jgi:hypothetical protein
MCHCPSEFIISMRFLLSGGLFEDAEEVLEADSVFHAYYDLGCLNQ